ncbi:unnamed protein product [Chironomus riparius]|uniref:RNA helicase n=1 Tax=Chironomus riparius TaxID=315576 RepID=A0A9N9S1H8_9DIPT|nr:unnamed protein product [Chironomus riparius]
MTQYNQNSIVGIIPQVDELYTGTVKDVNKHGLIVKLNGFSKMHEGLIHNLELMGDLNKLIIGNLIKVRIVSISDEFISMTTKNVEQPVNKGRAAHKFATDDRKRKIRVASPGRREVSQFTHSYSTAKVDVIKDEPPFLKNLSNSVTSSKIPKQINIFRDPNSNMARVAKAKMQNPAAIPFYFTESGFGSSWQKPAELHTIFEKLRLSSSVSASASSSSTSIDYKKRIKMSIRQQRESLPIFKFREEIIKAVTDNPVLIVIAETGSGKTTQIPQFLIEAGFILRGKIACTQPRRFAAMSVATRVADEYGCIIGQEVGYKIRFEDCSNPNTIIKYMTDGILLRECLSDANLDSYSVIILDEAHERTMHTDVLFGLLKEAVKRRPKLRLVISSATLDYAKFSQFFDNAKVLQIPGSMFPVETFYYTYQVTTDYLNAALNTVLNIHMREPDGDILLFLTGQEEIERACETLEEYIEKNRSRFNLDLIILPMFSALPPDMQSDVLLPAPKKCRKVIIATNIAEASVTIDGIKFVVDCGFAKQKINDPKTGMDMLTIIPISQASANQRLGRAGRTAPGKCYRLYSEKAYNEELLPETIPEIQRANLSQVVLHLKAIGVKNILEFDFMDPPHKDNILTSLRQLFLLGALDRNGDVTDLGRKMTELPVEPNLAKMLLVSVGLKCTDEIITIIAMLSAGNVFYRPRKKQTLADEKKKSFEHAVGDHLRALNVYKKWEINHYSSEWCKTNYLNEKKLLEAQDVRENLLTIMDKYKYEIYSAGFNYERVQMAICSGFFQNIARRPAISGRNNKVYKTIDEQECFIHPSSSLFHQLPSWIVYNNLTETTKKFLNENTVINPLWLQQLVPDMYRVTDFNPNADLDDFLHDLIF